MHYTRTTANVLLATLLAVTPLAAWADDEPLRYDQVRLSASASAEIDNDTLSTVLYAQKEGSDVASLANTVNQLITQAVKESKKIDGIKVQTLGYHTSPIYHKSRLTGWQVRQSIRLKSQQADRLSALLGRLQKSLAVESMSYNISTERRKKAEEALISQALDAFQKRAALITNKLGREQYRLVEMNVNSVGHSPRSKHLRMSAMSMDEGIAAPTMEAGSQKVQVNINGTIELQVD